MHAPVLGDVRCKYIPVRRKFSVGLVISPPDKIYGDVRRADLAQCDRAFRFHHCITVLCLFVHSGAIDYENITDYYGFKYCSIENTKS